MKPLQTIYCLAFILFITLSITYTEGYSQCNTPSVGLPSNVTPTTADATYNCCQQGTYYLEYGLTGFTPGTTTTPGAGGTVVTIPSNPAGYTITGLTPSTTYDYYIRIHCNAGTWTANSSKRTFSTAPDCNTVPVINCNTMTTLNVPAGPGAWSFNSASCFNISQGKEAIYKFTPAVSGTHVLFLHPVTNANQNPFSYYYKAASSGCNSTGWTCIGYGWPNQNNQLSFGPLTAGTTYLVMADAYNDFMATTADQFRIECPYCVQPSNIIETNKTPVSISLSWTGNASILEYGPNGFIPGTGSTAGTNGTVVFISGTSYTLSGLNPQTGYDIYLRSYCGGSNYSPNSLEWSTYTASCPTIGTYPSLGTYINLYSSGTGYWNGYPSCMGPGLDGQETIFQFTAPSSGYFDMLVSHDLSDYYGFMYRQSISGCNLNGYSCPTPTYIDTYTDYYSIGPLVAGTTYDLFFDVSDTTGVFPGTSFVINCPRPSGIATSNVQPNSIGFSWSCNCPASTYLEYGPEGFTPGTGSTAGANGTIIPNVSSPYNLTGLAANTKYDVYLRSSCGGAFSSNTSVLKIHTAVDCSTAPVISCSDYLSFCVNGFINTDNGAWQSIACGGGNHLSAESVWKFTPSQTGTYSILVYGFSANSIYYSYPATFYIKQASLGCNELFWNCVGNVSGSIYYGFPPVNLSLGTLTAGTTYLIMADGIQPTFTAGYCYNFRLECPNVCSWPKLVTVTDITKTTGKIKAVCDSCMGPVIVEYGQAGFTPGTGNAAGVGGTVISGTYFPVTITGLTSGVTYDVYARKNCGAPSGFSINSNKLSFTPCSTPPSSISTSTGNNFICVGDSITLTRVGGALGAGGSYKWYTQYCGGTLAGTGNSIKVSPSATTIYYLRAEANCGVTNCISISITVVAKPSATISATGSTTFCAGGSVILNSNTGSGLTYQWEKDGVNIPGATLASYTATQAGIYKVSVFNSSGCSAISSGLTVSVNNLPPATITASGPLTFCTGDSVILSVPFAANRTYQWIKYNAAIPGATSSTYTATNSGNYKVKVTNTITGCSKTTPTPTTVTVNAKPAATVTPQGPTTFCAGGSVVLAANTGSGLTYKWKKNGNYIAGATSSNYTATTAGTYKVEVTKSNGCSKLSSGVAVTVPCKEGESTSGNDFNVIVYPNPSQGFFNFAFHASSKEQVHIRIFDLTGRKVLETNAEINNSGSSIDIDMSTYTPGVYRWVISTSKETYSDKMVKL